MNTDRHFKNPFEDFLWPLATSYRIATKVSSNVNNQLDSYFKMFEMWSSMEGREINL
jgi:hypothetical protein